MTRENQSAGQKIMKFFPAITFVIMTFVGIIVGYTNLKSTVAQSEVLVKEAHAKSVENEKVIGEHTVELKNVKESLTRIESQNNKLDNKIDKVLEVIISQGKIK